VPPVKFTSPPIAVATHNHESPITNTNANRSLLVRIEIIRIVKSAIGIALFMSLFYHIYPIPAVHSPFLENLPPPKAIILLHLPGK
jgi:hypothetical protein